MDITTSMPPVQEGKTIANNHFKGFAMSLQGASHLRMEPPVPCQDYSDMRYMESEALLIAAVADGVGSCKLSHWGAYLAVTAVLDSVEQGLKQLAKGKRLPLDIESDALKAALKTIMVEGFDAAVYAVENCADNAQPPQPVFSLQSTLTLAIYDGRTLFHGHVGDDGIVVQNENGQVVLATKRLKGEEASSVYPLQSGKANWMFGATLEVAAFVMATDGVLDAFVSNRADYYGVNYNNGVFYGFMEDAVYKLAAETPGAAQNALEQYKAYLLSDAYRTSVTDDLTMVCVVSNEGIRSSRRPEFNTRIWRTIEEESTKARRLRLASKSLPEPPLGVIAKEEKAAAKPGSPVSEQIVELKSSMLVKGIVAGSMVVCLLAGLAVGRYFFPRISPKEYADLSELYTASEDRNTQNEEKIATLEADLEALKKEAAQREKELQQHKDEIDRLNQELEAQPGTQEDEQAQSHSDEAAAENVKQPEQARTDTPDKG